MGNKGEGVQNDSQLLVKAARENDLEGKMLNSGRWEFSWLISQVDLKQGNFRRESYVLGIFEQVIWHLFSTHAFVWLLMRGKENLIKIDYFVD